jgi:hypothetical protein
MLKTDHLRPTSSLNIHETGLSEYLEERDSSNSITATCELRMMTFWLKMRKRNTGPVTNLKTSLFKEFSDRTKFI